MARTDRNKVAVISIVDRSGGITEDGCGVGMQLTTCGNITAGKHSIVDEDTTLCLSFAGINIIRPISRPGIYILIFLRQGVQVGGRNIRAFWI